MLQPMFNTFLCNSVIYIFSDGGLTWWRLFNSILLSQCIWNLISAGFTYRLDRLKPRASKLWGPPAKVYNIFNTVIGLSNLCCHNVLSKQPFSNFPYTVVLHFRILQNFKHPWSSLPLLKLIKTLPSSSIREGGELGVASKVD